MLRLVGYLLVMLIVWFIASQTGLLFGLGIGGIIGATLGRSRYGVAGAEIGGFIGGVSGILIFWFSSWLEALLS